MKMFSLTNCLITCVIIILYCSKACMGDKALPSLILYMPNEPVFTDVLVRRVNDSMILVCEPQGDKVTPRLYVWNHVPLNGIDEMRPHKIEPTAGPSLNSTYTKRNLQISDSGQYMCSSPPFSVTKYILVQGPGPKYCARSAFWCDQRCMAAQYLCDGFKDCEHGEDESPLMCSYQVCSRPDKLNCSTGRCISESACCRTLGPLCQQPSCCDEYPRYSRLEGFVEVEYPPLHEDRHAPDDYGFIQSTIYTVTACALIFMIAVVLLVSAICKMHMKRAALRSYAHAERATRQHYNRQYAQAHRYPPCYEASRLLEQEARGPSPQPSPHSSPARQPLQCGTECPEPEEAPPPERGGLARLSSIFSSRYRQVPTQSDVELTNVRSTSLNNSPTRHRTLDNYRSPTYCDLNTSEFYFTNPETGNLGRDLNYLAVDYARPSALERVIDQLDRQRLTLQLGRFQLSIPRFGRRNDPDRRPDTPNVAEINIDDLDFVRMTSNDTYTLNGRTIRLLGANFENYPVLPDGTRPPPYNEAMRYKFFGPPPEYLSREVLNARVDEEARSNVEMPPGYEELATGENGGNNVTVNENNGNGNDNGNNGSCNDNGNVPNCNGDTVTGGDSYVPSNGNVATIDIRDSGNSDENRQNQASGGVTTTNTTNNDSTKIVTRGDNNNAFSNVNNNPVITITEISNSNNNLQSLSSIIDNLPAIDSDVNANDTLLSGVNDNVSTVSVANGN